MPPFVASVYSCGFLRPDGRSRCLGSRHGGCRWRLDGGDLAKKKDNAFGSAGASPSHLVPLCRPQHSAQQEIRPPIWCLPALSLPNRPLTANRACRKNRRGSLSTCCRAVALARGSRESGQALTGAALSGVLLCEGHFSAGDALFSERAMPGWEQCLLDVP